MGLWYVLNYIAPSNSPRDTATAVVERFNRLSAMPIEIFAPTFVEVVERRGRLVRRDRPLAFHYVFLRAPLAALKELAASPNGFSFILNRTGSTSRYVAIDNERLQAFRLIATAYGNELPCYPTAAVKLEEGDTVQVIDGPFAGLTGTYVPRRGARSGSLMIAVNDSHAAIVYDISAEYIRVLSFAKESKRLYDQLDSYIPRLFKALRLHSANQQLDVDTLTPLIIFARRLGETKVNNPKLDAKLRLLLMTTSRILGDREGYRKYAAQYERLASQITNPHTAALRDLLFAVSGIGRPNLKETLATLGGATDRDSSMLKMLREEVQFYLTNEN